uniref:Uncharacterized protein n=1 Tax=Fagus sylvatica TaxID=28930 RepID=A0A2N9GYJ9_FAGSY
MSCEETESATSTALITPESTAATRVVLLDLEPITMHSFRSDIVRLNNFVFCYSPENPTPMAISSSTLLQKKTRTVIFLGVAVLAMVD